ncbi:Erv1/Alr family protein (macronuclear) [Tetrahymena thermophila SB210]|uniref:Erv1/Alr family protein n=1 Tax=Tetrahymena thermophila (strain SB210) TaxID=312017 RepID=I7LWW3_TETTS|nr:Erv1/Alr family protein [Tetrahymena thermophila SB210]EAS02975.2 Erv1/Alr family protein [Tetrahymena thermophila SB210]|eukprot:XP_001023220.2 Erv1/Alr family protein [Tetrahymena thermophila SB210]
MNSEDLQLIRGVGFLKELSIFAQLEEKILKTIWPLCSFLKCERGQNVYQEGQIATHIYLIKEGEVSISRLLENDTKNTEKTQNLPERIIRKNLIWQSELAQKKKEKVVIAKLGENQYFGELELLTSNINMRYTRATCESQTILYSISKKLDVKNKEGIKINFNKLRMFSQKCQFIKEHMEKLQSKTKAQQEHQSQQNLNTQVIWQEDKDNKEPETFISSKHVSQMIKFFKGYNFGGVQNLEQQFILDILNKTKNHHLVRLQQLWKVLKEGKPSLRQSMGLEDNITTSTHDNTHTFSDQNDLDEKRKNLLSFMKKRNILSKQFTINSQDNKSVSAYSQQFRNTSQTCDKNTQFDEVISDDNFYEKERYNSIFQNTQSSQTQFQSRRGSSNVYLENQKYFVSYYNYGIMNQNKTNFQNNKNITQSSISHSKSQDLYLNNTNLFTSLNTSNNNNISLPWLQQKYSKPHFVKIYQKSNELKEFNKNIFIKPKLQIYS